MALLSVLFPALRFKHASGQHGQERKEAGSATALPQPVEWVRLGIGVGAIAFFSVAVLSHLFAPHSTAALQQRARELTAATLCAIAFALERRHRWGASLLALSALWLEPTLALAWRGTLVADSLLVYPPLIFVAGLILGSRVPIWGALATNVAVLVGVGAHRVLTGQPFFPIQDLHWFFVSAAVNFATALLTVAGLGAYRRAIVVSEAARRRYTQLFETAPDGLVELDRDGRITEANAAARLLLDRASPSLAGERFAEVLASGGGPADFDLANARSGAPVLIELGGKPPRSLEISVHSGDDGASGRTSLVVRDVTQRRLIEERLGHARRLEIVGQLAGGVAHEINNPLAFVKANLETMVDEVLGARTLTDAAFREMVDDMQLGVERIRRIVLDLQTFAHEDGGGFVEACDVPQVVEETMHLVAARVKGRVPMEISLPKDCPQVHTTSSRLCLALSNLLINAADALAGQPSPKVSLRVVAEADGLRFSVEDNGPGFGDDVLKNAGEPFVTSRAPGRGAGLGLALSREFVKRAGGSIRVENRAEGGARITFWLRQA